MNLLEAENIAQTFISKIHLFCKRIEIAGSIRRKKPQVNDIEIVCIPKTGEQVQPMLFGEPIRTQVNFLHDFLMDLRNQDIIRADRISRDGRRAPFGPRYYRITYGEYPIDLFCVLPPADWGVIFTLRTGPAEYSHWLATEALRKGMKVKDGQLFKEEGYLKIPCPEEQNFFKALGLEWMPPEKRKLPAELLG